MRDVSGHIRPSSSARRGSNRFDCEPCFRCVLEVPVVFRGSPGITPLGRLPRPRNGLFKPDVRQCLAHGGRSDDGTALTNIMSGAGWKSFDWKYFGRASDGQ